MPNKSNLLSKEKTTKQNRIWVRIASACNSACIFCLDSDAQNGTFQEEEKVRKQMKDGFKEGYENRVILSGGEASINPKFANYIQYAKELGYDRVQTITNGIMFAKEDFCHQVFRAGLEEVTFSLHGHTRELHDHLTGTSGSFDKALRGLLFVKKHYPKVIVNIDIVVNKINVDFLPKIVAFYMRLGVYEFDILQIIPFGRGFSEHKDTLFYKISEHLPALHDTWKLSRIPGVYMWTNRFPAEAFEGYEDLIQDPRKIRPEVMGESYDMFEPFIRTGGKEIPVCLGESCDVCFLNQYCHDFLSHSINQKAKPVKKYIIAGMENRVKLEDAERVVLHGEEFPSDVYAKYGEKAESFIQKIQSIPLHENQQLMNIPKCIRLDHNNGEYEWCSESDGKLELETYTKDYILNFYRKKSTRCSKCKYNTTCEGIHINFIRSYGFSLLQPIIDV